MLLLPGSVINRLQQVQARRAFARRAYFLSSSNFRAAELMQ